METDQDPKKESAHGGFLGTVYAKIAMVFGTLGTVVLATFLRGDLITVYIHSKRLLEEHFGLTRDETPPVNKNQSFPEGSLDEFLSQYKLQDLQWHILFAMTVPLVSYMVITSCIYWYYDVSQKENAKEWKLQPTKFNTRKQLLKGFKIGCFNMGVSGLISGTIACYVVNGGYCLLYYRIEDYGIVYTVLSTVGVFMMLEGLSYYFHRMYHLPILYKRMHKWHHQFPYPAALQATAFHPLEFANYQLILAVPLFTVPTYAGCYIVFLLWQYYYGIIDHTGINFTSIWPWQPPVKFHDDHHKYFHCNYGFNVSFYDWLHDTTRRTNRKYAEDIYHPEQQPNKAA